jgi:hypothetical protein
MRVTVKAVNDELAKRGHKAMLVQAMVISISGVAKRRIGLIGRSECRP